MLTLKRFRDLEKRELHLRKRFLRWSAKNKAFGTPTNDEIRAYFVLFHAEIEAYIEDVARDGIEHSKSLLNQKNVANGVMFCLVASAHNIFDDNIIDEGKRFSPDRFQKPKSKMEWVDICGKQGHKIIGDNNGIREENLLKMFRPLGVDISSMDRTWLNDMTQLGSDRGNIAHNTMQVQHVPNLNDLVGKVGRILEGCASLRVAMLEVCRTSVPAHIALASDQPVAA